MLHALLVGCVARVREQLFAADQAAQALEHVLRGGGEADPGPVARAKHAGGRNIGVAGADRLVHQAELVVFDRQHLEQAHHRLGARQVDLLPGRIGVFRSMQQRGEDAEGAEHPGDRITDRIARMDGRLARCARDVGQAGVGLEQARESGIARVRSGLAEAGHPQDLQFRLRAPESCLVEAPAVQRAGSVILDQHVEARQQPQQQRLAFGLAQVERDRALVAVHRLPQERLAVLVGRQGAQRVAAAGKLHLEHVRAEIAEQGRGEWSGDDVGNVEDPKAGEGAAHSLNFIPRVLKFSISESKNPQSANACLPPAPRSGGAPRIAPGVREKRGAGEGWSTLLTYV